MTSIERITRNSEGEIVSQQVLVDTGDYRDGEFRMTKGELIGLTHNYHPSSPDPISVTLDLTYAPSLQRKMETIHDDPKLKRTIDLNRRTGQGTVMRSKQESIVVRLKANFGTPKRPFKIRGFTV